MKQIGEMSEKSGRKCDFGKCESSANNTKHSNTNKNTKHNLSKIFRNISLFVLATALFFFTLIIAISPAFALQDLMALQGTANNLGDPIASGNLTITIWTQSTGGTLVYNSSTDYDGAITGGRFDIMLGDGSVELNLDYGVIYYMDMEIDGQDLDFNGTERRSFESSVGKITNISIVSNAINHSHILDNTIIDADISTGAAIAKSKISTSGTWTEAEIPSLTDTWAGIINASKIVSQELLNVNSSTYSTNASYATTANSCTYVGGFDEAALTTLNNSIGGGISGSGTNQTIPMWTSNNTLENSPISHIITDADNLLMYNGTLYIDDTNAMVGVNIVPGTESYAGAFTVQSPIRQGHGEIQSAGDYDLISNSTLVDCNETLPESFVDAGSLYVNDTTYYIYSIENETAFRVLGNWSSSYSSSNWSWRQAPYIDIDGPADSERGYTISSDGTWQWAMYTPDYSNNSQFCVQNRNAWFNGNYNAYCIDSTGDMRVYGNLKATSITVPLYSGFAIDNGLVDNGDGTITVLDNRVNCYDSNEYINILREYDISGGTTGTTLPALTQGIDVVNYLVVDCDSGSPFFTITTDSSIIDGLRYLMYAKIMTLDAINLHIEREVSYGTGLSERNRQRLLDTQEYAISKDTTLSLEILTDLNVSIGGINVWAGVTEYSVPATNSSTIAFLVMHNSDGSWNSTFMLHPKLNNTHYDNGTAQVAFTPGYYGIMDVWRGVEEQDQVYFKQTEREYENFDQANSEILIPDVPKLVSEYALYVGRIIFEADNASNVVVKPHTSGTFFASSPNQNHNSLSGLDGGLGGSYYHLGQSDYQDVLDKIWLNKTDQRYNDTAAISLKLNATDQRYNDTARINAVNTTTNIQILGFNTTSQLNNLYYSISNPNAFINASSIVSAVGNWSSDKSSYNTTAQLDTKYMLITKTFVNNTGSDTYVYLNDSSTVRYNETKLNETIVALTQRDYFTISDYSTTSNTVWTLMSDFTIPLPVGKSIIVCTFMSSAAATTTGVRLRLNTTGTGTQRTVMDYYTSTTAQALCQGTTASTSCLATVSSGATVSPTRIITYADRTVAGSMTLELISEVSTSAVNILAGSSCYVNYG
jgi:hypothetical protein